MDHISKNPYKFVSKFLNIVESVTGYDYDDDNTFDLYTEDDYMAIYKKFQYYISDKVEPNWSIDEDNIYKNSITLVYNSDKDGCRFILFHFIADKSEYDTNVSIVIENVY